LVDLLLFFAAIFSFLVIGYPFAYFLLVRESQEAYHVYSYMAYIKEYGRTFVLIISFFFGTLVAALYLNILSFFPGGYSFVWAASLTGAFLIADIVLLVFARKRFKKSSRSSLHAISDAKFLLFEKKQKVQAKSGCKERLKRLSADSRFQNIVAGLLIAFIVFHVATSLFFAVLYPVRFWDAISCYSLKAKAFFIDASIMPFYSEHGHSFSFLSYPIYFSLVQTWVMIGMRHINENILKILFSIFNMGLFYILYFLFAKRFHRLLALGAVFVFSGLPIVIDHGYIEYPNMLFGTLLLLGVYFYDKSAQIEDYRCAGYVKDIGQIGSEPLLLFAKRHPFYAGNASLVIATVFFSMLAILRVEGMFYLGLFLLLHMIASVANSVKRAKAGRAAGHPVWSACARKSALQISIPILLSFLIYLPWMLVLLRFRVGFWGPDWDRAASQGQAIGMHSILQAARAFGAQFLFSDFDSTRAFLGSSYGVLWIVLALLFFVHVKRMFAKGRWVYFLFILFNFLSVFAASVYIKEFIGSMERYMLASLPLAYYYVLSNSFKKRKEMQTKIELPQQNPNQSRRF
jgi:hypothetical protein